jgi:glycosyltransferase involved in cell wall biosynthesis
MAYRSATSLVALSPGIHRGINRIVKDESKITMIPNGCDIDLFSRQEPRWRPDGVRPSDLMAVFTGSHGLANGLDAVLDAAKLLKQRGRDDIKIVLVGDGSQKKALQDRARSEQLTNVVFVPNVTKNKIVGLLAEADLGLQILANVPAFYDGTSPNKFFDYLAAGLPVLINYPGWLAETVEARECGVGIEPCSAPSFANTLESYADHPERLVDHGVRARALASDQFDRNTLSAAFVRCIEDSTDVDVQRSEEAA